MQEIWIEIKELFNKRYSFLSLLGYFVGVLNFYIYILIINKLDFSLLFFIFFFCITFIVNFIFSAITSLYVDLQNEDHIRARDMFYFYGLSEYITFLFIPLAYFKVFSSLLFNPVLVISLMFILIWLMRIWMIKRNANFGYVNSFIAVFFPHILIFTVSFISVAVTTVALIFGGYA